jgi:hypothetical protein
LSSASTRTENGCFQRGVLSDIGSARLRQFVVNKSLAFDVLYSRSEIKHRMEEKVSSVACLTTLYQLHKFFNQMLRDRTIMNGELGRI